MRDFITAFAASLLAFITGVLIMKGLDVRPFVG